MSIVLSMIKKALEFLNVKNVKPKSVLIKKGDKTDCKLHGAHCSLHPEKLQIFKMVHATVLGIHLCILTLGNFHESCNFRWFKQLHVLDI